VLETPKKTISALLTSLGRPVRRGGVPLPFLFFSSTSYVLFSLSPSDDNTRKSAF